MARRCGLLRRCAINIVPVMIGNTGTEVSLDLCKNTRPRLLAQQYQSCFIWV